MYSQKLHMFPNDVCGRVAIMARRRSKTLRRLEERAEPLTDGSLERLFKGAEGEIQQC